MIASSSFAFASYSARDADSVLPIVEALHSRGFNVWIDRKELAPGVNWSNSIVDAVRDARVLLWFAGRGTSTSEWMTFELQSVLERGDSAAIVIPVLVAGAEPEKLPAIIRARQWLDARVEIATAIERLAAVLEEHLGKPREAEAHASTTQNKGYVFISYSVNDKTFLTELKSFLKSKAYGYWDFHENKRDYQAQFHLELEAVISDARAVLCVVTTSWKHSRWAPREYLFAEDIRKPTFLLRAEAMKPTLLIAGSSYIDFVGDRDFAFLELERELSSAGL